MSTNEKIEIKEAVDNLGLEVKRRDGLSNLEIRGALVYKGLVLKSQKTDGSYRTTVLSREQTVDLIEKMQLALEVSKNKETELRRNRVIDFRLSEEMKYLLKALARKKHIASFRTVAWTYFDEVLSSECRDAIRDAVAYKYDVIVARVSYVEIIDELLNQYAE